MNSYKLDNTFLVRTPLLSYNSFLDYVEKGKNYAEQKQRLREVYQNPILQEALYLASPVLYNEYLKSNNDTIEEENRLLFSLMRYLLRMSTRCTPFGLFAGCSLGSWSDKNNMLLGNLEDYKKHTRPDMNYLSALAESLSKTEEIRDFLLFYPNNSLYKFGSKLRYVDFSYESNSRKHNIVAIDDSIYLQAILKDAKKGITLQGICAILERKNIPYERSKDFALELIDARILVSEITENTTGEEMMHRLINVLFRIEKSSNSFKKNNQYLKTLLDIREKINDIDQQNLGINIKYYTNISEELIKLDTKFNTNHLFQTDMIKPLFENQLDNKLAGTIRRGLEVLNKLTSQSEETNLTLFIKRFSERYETKEIPLLEALDVETGIGYLQMNNDAMGDINPLIDTIPIFSNHDSEIQLTWNKKQTFLFQKLLYAFKNNLYEIQLKDEELSEFKPNWNDLPSSLYVMASITNLDSQEKKSNIHVISVGGSATHILGRFTHCDNEINTWVQNIADQEQSLYDDETIIAEIVHIPESRTGNILMRTAFRKYEIPYLAVSLLDEEYQLLPKDLTLSISSGELVLRSKKLNKRIIPNLGNAHNYSFNALPVYQFLCDLQYQVTV